LAAQRLSLDGLGCEGGRRVAKDAYLDGLIAASNAKVSFESYCDWTKSSAWTMVHGDFHPSNMMWMSDCNAIKILDWEMVCMGFYVVVLCFFLFCFVYLFFFCFLLNWLILTSSRRKRCPGHCPVHDIAHGAAIAKSV
jgi:hypothetical protein